MQLKDARGGINTAIYIYMLWMVSQWKISIELEYVSESSNNLLFISVIPRVLTDCNLDVNTYAQL